MNFSKLGVVGAISSLANRLRFPWLFLLFLVAFLANLLIPDPVPFIDELVLGLGALLLARLQKQTVKPPPRQQPPQ